MSLEFMRKKLNLEKHYAKPSLHYAHYYLGLDLKTLLVRQAINSKNST